MQLQNAVFSSLSFCSAPLLLLPLLPAEISPYEDEKSLFMSHHFYDSRILKREAKIKNKTFHPLKKVSLSFSKFFYSTGLFVLRVFYTLNILSTSAWRTRHEEDKISRGQSVWRIGQNAGKMQREKNV